MKLKWMAVGDGRPPSGHAMQTPMTMLVPLILMLWLTPAPAVAAWLLPSDGYSDTYGPNHAPEHSTGDMFADNLIGAGRPHVPSDDDQPRPIRMPPTYDAPRGDMFKSMAPKDGSIYRDLFRNKRDTPPVPPYKLFADRH